MCIVAVASNMPIQHGAACSEVSFYILHGSLMDVILFPNVCHYFFLETSCDVWREYSSYNYNIQDPLLICINGDV